MTITQKMVRPKVTVCVVTYNQEKYIEKCLHSIVTQKTDFKFDVIIGDDCSTDNTLKIVKKFTDSHRNITLLNRTENVGALKNYTLTHERALGEFVCHVDGDDYCLPGKLSSQVKILENNPQVSFTTHAMQLIDNDGSDIFVSEKNNCPKIGTIETLLELGTYFQNSSVMYRKDKEYNHKNMKLIDFYVHIERAVNGDIYYDTNFYGVHRQHPGGISKNHSMYDELEECYELAHDRAISLGVDKTIVTKGRMKRRMSFALNRMAIGDVKGYKKLINCDVRHFKYISRKHFILNIFKNCKMFNSFIKKIQDRKQTLSMDQGNNETK